MDVVTIDCDGTLMDSTPELLKVSKECVGKFFSVSELNIEKAEELVARFGGQGFASGFKKALEDLFPGEENNEKREKCCQMMIAKRKEIYDRVKPFPETIKTLERLSKKYHLVISSGLERNIIVNWLERNGFRKNLFETIYSLEDGSKDTHLQLIRMKYPGAGVFYVGDSLIEMRLGDVSIGIAKSPWHQELLLRGGAQLVVSSLEKILNVL
jgi:phosphoglycolate phosphatase-like HAD superfamily hydrolase